MGRIKDFLKSRGFFLALLIVFIVNIIELFLKLKWYMVFGLYITTIILVLLIAEYLHKISWGGTC